MKQIQIHPDNLVIIREDGEVLYLDSKENFELDYGTSLETLPEGWNERLYIQGMYNRLCNQFTQQTSFDSWTQGEDILDNVQNIIDAKTARLE
jgi:hypothetical protein